MSIPELPPEVDLSSVIHPDSTVMFNFTVTPWFR